MEPQAAPRRPLPAPKDGTHGRAMSPNASADGPAADADLPTGSIPNSIPAIVTAYINAFAMLSRHDIIGLAITLSVLCFAVVAAILLLRTRERLAVTTANARDEIIS